MTFCLATHLYRFEIIADVGLFGNQPWAPTMAISIASPPWAATSARTICYSLVNQAFILGEHPSNANYEKRKVISECGKIAKVDAFHLPPTEFLLSNSFAWKQFWLDTAIVDLRKNDQSREAIFGVRENRMVFDCFLRCYEHDVWLPRCCRENIEKLIERSRMSRFYHSRHIFV